MSENDIWTTVRKRLVDKPCFCIQQIKRNIMLIPIPIKCVHPASVDQNILVKIYPKVYLHSQILQYFTLINAV